MLIKRTFTSRDVTRRFGVNIKTVQRWDREGRVRPAGRTATGRRDDTEDQILAVRRQWPDPQQPRKMVAYCRKKSTPCVRTVLCGPWTR
jgi:predicted site-specific integrase-resolvase